MIIFELAKEQDLDKLVLAVISFKSELSNCWQEGQTNRIKKTKSKAQIKEELNNQISRTSNFYLLAKEKDAIIGLCHGVIKKTNHLINKPIKYGYFDYIWVKPEYRNKKIGSKLKNKLFSWFKRNNCNFIELKVLENNPALSIYQNWGFKAELLTMRKPLLKS